MKKYKGSVTSFIVFCTMGVVIIFLFGAIVKRASITTLGQGMQDDLVLSNSTVYKHIDKEILGSDSQLILIKDPTKAFDEMKQNLVNNMNLNSDMTSKTDGSNKGKIKIKDFIIYNYKGASVDIITYNEANNTFRTETKDLSREVVVTVNGHTVKSTTITTTLSFELRSFFGRVTNQQISVDTDLIGN